MGHWNGDDVSTASGMRRLALTIKETKPRGAVTSPTCRAFYPRHRRFNASKSSGARTKLDAIKKRGRLASKNLRPVAEMILAEIPGSEVDLELPRNGEAWQETDLSALAQHFHRPIINGRAYALRDETSQELISWP